MSILGKMLGTVIDVAALPVDVIRDVIPGGGGYADGHAGKTAERADKIVKDVEDVTDAARQL